MDRIPHTAPLSKGKSNNIINIPYMFKITIESFIFFYFLFFSVLGLTFKLFNRRIDDVVGVDLSLRWHDA